MSGGSGNQLELPRKASGFFTGSPPKYVMNHRVVAELTLVHGGRAWDDRRLTWHGNNRMERVNLPTRQMGGFADYAEHAVMFTRKGDDLLTFELDIAPLGSPEAHQWRERARQSGGIFDLGEGARSARACGLF